MNLELIYEHTKRVLESDLSGHDLNHISRVTKLGMQIAESEGLTDEQIDVMLASIYLHDTIDDKVVSNVDCALQDVIKVLIEAEATLGDTQDIIHTISNMSYSHNLKEYHKLTLVGQIVREADFLDTIGSIGIARVFLYGGINHNPLYDDTPIRDLSTVTIEEYRSPSSIYNHFFEKLFNIQNFMVTDEAKRICKVKTDFMIEFIKLYELEIDKPQTFK